MQRLIRFATRELETAQEQLMLLGNASAEEKVTAFLVWWRDRLESLTGVPERVPLPMRRQDIADYLGLNLETLSRTLGKLERKNAIRLVPKGVLLMSVGETLATGRHGRSLEQF
jgi:CRP/FNR family transcriptional regulator